MNHSEVDRVLETRPLLRNEPEYAMVLSLLDLPTTQPGNAVAFLK
jgi:hypothetical protein